LHDDDAEQPSASYVEGQLEFGGMPSIEFIADVCRAAIAEASLSHKPKLQGLHVLAALESVLPATRGFVKKLVRTEQTEVDFEYVEAADRGREGCVMVRLTAYLDLAECRKHYESVENILGHIHTLELDLMDGSALPAEARASAGAGSGARISLSRASELEVARIGSSSPYFLRLRLNNKGRGAFTVQVSICMRQDSSELLFVDKHTEYPAVGVDERTLRAVRFNIAEPQLFLASVNLSVRLAELGCANYAVPAVYAALHYHGREKRGAPERFDLRLLYVEQQGLLTRALAKPFINLDLLRSLLVSRMRISVSVRETDFAARTGKFELNYAFTLVKPRAVFLLCLVFFVKQQVGSLSVLDLLRDLFSALGQDLRAFGSSRTKLQ
jgi:hypothetical protein